MDLNRTLRVLRARWPWVVVFVVLGFAAGVFGATRRNAGIVPVMRAEAPVTIVTSIESRDNPSGASPEFVQARLDEALAFALEVNGDLLAANPRSEIVTNTDLGRLTFIARARTADEAQNLAAEMRNRYLTRQPPNAQEQIQTQLDQIAAQMDEVRTKIDALGPTTVVDPVEERRSQLNSLLAALRADAQNFEKELLVGSDRPEDEIQADLDRTNLAISTVLSDLEELGPVPDTEFSEEETLRRALEREYRELESSYQELFLQRAALSGPVVSEVIDVADETPKLMSRGIAGGVGLIVGLVLAVVGLVVVDRLFKPVWTGLDLAPLPLLGHPSTPGWP